MAELASNGGLSPQTIRAPSLKRGRIEEKITDRVKLERVLGVTITGNAALATDNQSTFAYPAGCTVVLFNTKTEAQEQHIINVSRKTITCLAFSTCGRYIVTGECGHQPTVRIWDVNPSGGAAPTQIAEFGGGHKYGINCVAFSPNGRLVVSIGSQHDMIVNVWDWRQNVKVASNKVSTKVKALAFAPHGAYFVTVGNRLVKFWYLDAGGGVGGGMTNTAGPPPTTTAAATGATHPPSAEAVPLMGRSAILGEQRNNYFCDVTCTAHATYAITRTGLLCEFNARRLLDKWINVCTTRAHCVCTAGGGGGGGAGESLVLVGCADAIVRCFHADTLQFVTTLPRCHYLGVDVAAGRTIQHMLGGGRGANAGGATATTSTTTTTKYPDVIALAHSAHAHKLCTVYNDHSVYVWDVRDIYRVGKSVSFLYHSACIWGVEMVPVAVDAAAAAATTTTTLPPHGAFLTCSSDDTIRVWVGVAGELEGAAAHRAPNVYSHELLKVIYIDDELNYLRDTVEHAHVGDKSPLDTSTTTSGSNNNNQCSGGGGGGSYDGRHGVRCVRISPCGRHLASGDRAGNIRVYEVSALLATSAKSRHGASAELVTIEAHDAEVLCLEYSAAGDLMASASRDRLLHVFDVRHNYEFLQTLADHTSSITAVRFLGGGGDDYLTMLSCGADKTLIARAWNERSREFQRVSIATARSTLYDMVVDRGGRHVATACQDRNVRIYSVHSGKFTRSYRATLADAGTLIKCALDASGTYLATSCTDKSLTIYDYYAGECVASICGHSELATGLQFSADCRHLVSASGDGCVFVWRLPAEMVAAMRARLRGNAVGPTHMRPHNDVDFLNVNELPQWARKQLGGTSAAAAAAAAVTVTGEDAAHHAPPKNRWAQRASNAPIQQPFGGESEDSGSWEEQQQQRIAHNALLLQDESSGFESSNGAHDSDHNNGALFTVRQQVVVNVTDGEDDAEEAADEEEDVISSTPSGENPLSSLFSNSAESLVGGVGTTAPPKHDRYFDGLMAHEAPTSKKTISSKWLLKTGGGASDAHIMAAINSVKSLRNDPDTVRRRQLLNRRIADAKKKLETVGTSKLKYSQSTQDLSQMPAERDHWLNAPVRGACASNAVSHLNTSSTTTVTGGATSASSSNSLLLSLRRSCSLSDLSVAKPRPRPPPSLVGGLRANSNHAQQKSDFDCDAKAPSVADACNKQQQQRNKWRANESQLNRSQSVAAAAGGMLNASDDDSDGGEKTSRSVAHQTRLSRLMRPTISSHMKVNSNPSVAHKNLAQAPLPPSPHKKHHRSGGATTVQAEKLSSLSLSSSSSMSSTTDDDDNDSYGNQSRPIESGGYNATTTAPNEMVDLDKTLTPIHGSGGEVAGISAHAYSDMVAQLRHTTAQAVRMYERLQRHEVDSSDTAAAVMLSNLQLVFDDTCRQLRNCHQSTSDGCG